jgi:predicted PurR-regulated permease PerM
MPETTKIEISTNIIFKTILIILGLLFLYLVRDVILLLIISVIVVSAIDPVIDWLQRKKVRRPFGVLFVYLAIFLIIGVSFSFLIPPMASQIDDFSQNFPKYYQSAQNSFGLVNQYFLEKHINISTQQFFDNLSNFITNFPTRIFSTTIGVFSGLISTIVVFSLTFYMSIKEDGIKKFIVSIVPDKHKDYAADLTYRIKHKIGRWMIGQLTLMFLIFVFDFIGLYLVGVPYALLLAVFAGILEIIPYVGPIVSAIPGILLGFLISPGTGLLAFLVYLVSQQFENNIIVPQIMKKAVGLSPVTVILALLVGAKLAGALGAILAIPVATAVSLFVADLKEKV